MIEFLKSLISPAKNSASSKRFSGISLVYSLIFTLICSVIYFMVTGKILNVSDTLIVSLTGLAGALLGSTVIENIKKE